MRQFVVAIAILALAAGAASAQSRAPEESTLTVHGQGRVEVPPDRAHLTVDVMTIGKTLESATTAHRDRADRATKALRGMESSGLKIDRSTFRLDEVRPPIGPVSGSVALKPEYQADTTFELTLSKLDTVDSAVTAIATTGLFEVRNIRFDIADRNPGLKQARKEAIADARDKASTYADAAGVKLESIARIEDNGSGGSPELAAVPMLRSSMKVIPPDTLTLSANVTVTWRIADRP